MIPFIAVKTSQGDGICIKTVFLFGLLLYYREWPSPKVSAPRPVGYVNHTDTGLLQTDEG